MADKQKELKKQKQKIESIYNSFLRELTVLNSKQIALINQLIEELETKKIEQIKKA